MKDTPSIKVAVLALVLATSTRCFPQATRASDAGNAKEFVAGLYASYGRNSAPPNLFEGNAKDAFDPSLILLAKTDADAARPDVGVLDYDPVCNCQDPDVSFPNLEIKIKSVDKSRATAIITFSGDNHEPNKIDLTLRKEKGHWRIFNIEDLSGPGPHTDLRTMLKADIHKLSSTQK
jgi:hypothetical protein